MAGWFLSTPPCPFTSAVAIFMPPLPHRTPCPFSFAIFAPPRPSFPIILLYKL
jgi:hypothetical protein